MKMTDTVTDGRSRNSEEGYGDVMEYHRDAPASEI